MPELPEVETIRRQITPHITGKKITEVITGRDRAIRENSSPEEFIGMIQGARIVESLRRGKVIVLTLSNGNSILFRLGMSGRVYLAPTESPLLNHTHVRILLSDHNELRFVDPRTFGSVTAVTGTDILTLPTLEHYGCEPFDKNFTPEKLREVLNTTKVPLQAALMDQSKVTGIGKIYADEVCFQAKLPPLKPAYSLTDEEIIRLHTAIHEILAAAISARGTSNRDASYRDADGNHGTYQNQLKVYQRENKPCRECGELINYKPFAGRRIHYCPNCQK
ncbi:MAG: bifunctional DNA-formamidopyrimidine glycosylase/DNA-(apurinic or apyrimidinic site) lyase [bacterium]